MRWTERKSPQEKDTKIIEKFLWWPKKIGDETRWLEKCKIFQCYDYGEWKYKSDPVHSFYSVSFRNLIWKNIAWIDDNLLVKG